MTTKKLFWEDPYLKECKAKVTAIDGKNVTLDQTIIFAFSGGQATDKATINGINVVEALANDDIIHTLESEPNFKVGDEVTLKIDWENRYKIMKLHSAVHLVYFAFKEVCGEHEVIGSNVTSEKGRIDFAFDKNVSEFLPQIEQKVKEIISKDLEIKTYFDENEPGKRWWEIPGLYKMPCGGTHVKRTSEIGEIKLKRKNIGAGKERIEITLC